MKAQLHWSCFGAPRGPQQELQARDRRRYQPAARRKVTSAVANAKTPVKAAGASREWVEHACNIQPPWPRPLIIEGSASPNKRRFARHPTGPSLCAFAGFFSAPLGSSIEISAGTDAPLGSSIEISAGTDAPLGSSIEISAGTDAPKASR